MQKIINYKYPDRDDETTSTVIEENLDWDEDEKKALEYGRSYVCGKGLFIDAGCGLGRLTIQFAPYFMKVIAIEPDAERLVKARENIDQTGLSEKVEFMNMPLEDMSIKNEADLIISSHVIQHISIRSIPVVMQKMFNALRRGGKLILTTANSPITQDRYLKSFVEAGSRITKEVAEEEFEALLLGSKSLLPTHQFSEQSLKKILNGSGFELLGRRPFHINSKYINGIDVLIVANKN